MKMNEPVVLYILLKIYYTKMKKKMKKKYSFNAKCDALLRGPRYEDKKIIYKKRTHGQTRKKQIYSSIRSIIEQ